MCKFGVRFLFGVILIFTIYVSCRKSDHFLEKPDEPDYTTAFFESRKSGDPIIQSMSAYIRGQNEKNQFITDIVKKMGVPYWDKAMLYNLTPTKSGSIVNDSSFVAYIPLIQNGQSIVDGQLTIKATPTDTTYSFLLNTAYDDFGFLPNADSLLNGLKVFAMFANHEKNVFGHTEFLITDNRILHGQTALNISMSKRYMLKLDTSAGTGRGNVMAGPPPLPNSSCMQVNELIDAGYTVNYSTIGGICVISSYSLGGGSQGGSGGSGGGGGGTGWTSGGGSSNPPPAEPFDSLLKKAALIVNKYRDSLSALCEADSVERFFNIADTNNVYGIFGIVKGEKGNDVNPNYYISSGTRKGEWHYHHKYKDGTSGSWPSGADVIKLKDKQNGHVMIVDTYDARYALVVENATQFATWRGIFGNGPAKFPERVIDSVNADPRVWTTGASYVQMTKEKLIACLGSAASSGIGLYQGSAANGTTFIKVN